MHRPDAGTNREKQKFLKEFNISILALMFDGGSLKRIDAASIIIPQFNCYMFVHFVFEN